MILQEELPAGFPHNIAARNSGTRSRQRASETATSSRHNTTPYRYGTSLNFSFTQLRVPETNQTDFS